MHKKNKQISYHAKKEQSKAKRIEMQKKSEATENKHVT